MLGFFCVNAQEKLTFDQALTLMLEQNYDIKMQEITKEKANNSATLMNADFLPSLSADGGAGWTYFAGVNRLQTQEIDLNANSSYTYDAGITLNYILFNGFSRKYRLLINQESAHIAEEQLKLLVQNSILELSRSYYELAFLKENVSLLQSSFDISKDRLLRAKYGYEYGKNSQLDVLSAKVDYNTDSIAVLNAQLDYNNAQRNLNLLLGEDIERVYDVDNQVVIESDIALNEVLTQTTESNIDLKINEANYISAKYAMANARSPWMPVISTNAGYNYRGSEDPNGAFLIGSTRYGPQAAVRLTWNLFDGKNVVNQKNAKLEVERSEIAKSKLEQQVKAQAYNSFSLYQNAMAVLNAQEDNVATASRNFERSKEAKSLGQITNADYRLAQLNYLQALQNRSKAKFDAKNAELQVKAVMGVL